MIIISGKQYKELRCYRCQNFIVYHSISAGILYYKCPRCNYENEFTFKYLKTKDNEATIKNDYEVEVNMKGGEK